MNEIRPESMENLLSLARRRLALFVQLQGELTELCRKTTVEEIDEIRALTDRQHTLAAEIDRVNRDYFEALGGSGLDEASFGGTRAEDAPGFVSRGFEELRGLIGRQREVLRACRLLNEDAVRLGTGLQASVKKKLSQIRQQRTVLSQYCPAGKSCSGVLLDIRVRQLCRP